MSPRKHISLLIVSGPEVRAFIHSGLLEELSRDYVVSLIARERRSAAFTDIPAERLCELPVSHEPPGLSRLRGWARESKLAWLQTQGKHKWKHYLPPATTPPRARNSAIQWLRSRPRTVICLSAMERALGRFRRPSPPWRDIFRRFRTDCLVSAGFSSAPAICALQAASNLGIKTVVVTNSWKDIYVCPHVPVPPDRLVVWSPRATQDVLLANPNLSSDSILISPSLHLQPFFAKDEFMSRSEFCSLMHLDPGLPFITYTAASPAAVQDEEQIVEALLRAIAQGHLPSQPQLLLRLNPMEDGSRFTDLQNHYSALKIQKPIWEWDAKKDWCCALKTDTELWASTVFHSAMNVSVASTTTLEFAALGRPVVNVCFDPRPDLPPEKSTRRFWLADFYADVREAALASPAFNFDQLVARIRANLLVDGKKHCPQFAETKETPVQNALDTIRAVLN